MASTDVRSYMTFLSRNELYHTEKPYATDFPVDDNIEGANMTNHLFDTHPVTFHDARAAKVPLSLGVNGFCFVKAKTSLWAETATPERTEVMEEYMREVADVVRETVREYSEVRPMEF